MPSVATGLAPTSLRLGAFLLLMSVLLAVEASDSAMGLFHEDQHFCRSSLVGCKGHRFRGVVLVRNDGWGEHVLHLALKGVI